MNSSRRELLGAGLAAAMAAIVARVPRLTLVRGGWRAAIEDEFGGRSTYQEGLVVTAPSGARGVEFVWPHGAFVGTVVGFRVAWGFAEEARPVAPLVVLGGDSLRLTVFDLEGRPSFADSIPPVAGSGS